MATFTITEVKSRGARGATALFKSAGQVLKESVQGQTTSKEYDIFLSHSFQDAEIVLGIKGLLEDHGYSVYVDWIEDKALDRTNVSPRTAAVLRERMNCCRCLFYASTDNSSSSKWMPWECGYMDGRKSRTAVLPVTRSGSDSFDGQEYLGLYPYVTKGQVQGASRETLWIQWSSDNYVAFDQWLEGKNPYKR